MPVERRDPAVCNDSNKKEGKGEMTKAPICLQDLRRSLYVKAKAEPTWRFWGLYVHVCKMETLHEAYWMAKKNDGAPGIDGVEAIEQSGSSADPRRIGLKHVSTHASTEEGDTEGWGHQSPCPLDSLDPRSCGS